MVEVLLVIIMTSLACGILGPFIVLRGLSMSADALSHSVLLGIVVAFMFVRNLNSIWLIFGASIFGIITVLLVEFLSKKKLVKKDDALGIVFPLFFSVAVVIITKFFRNVHIDVEIVLMGNPLFSPFIRLFGLPRSFVIMFFMFIVNLLFILIFYKELKISTFDEDYSKLKNIKSNYLFYALMTLTSFTCVSAFDSVGAILVISFFVTPVASALLLTNKLEFTIILTLFFGLINSLLGFLIGIYFNVSISGMCSFIGMVCCLIVILVNPNGYILKKINIIKMKNKLMCDLICVHIYRHNENEEELGIESIHKHLNWDRKKSDNFINKLIDMDLIEENVNLKMYQLTKKGVKHVKILLGN